MARQGGKHVSVLLLDDPKKTPVQANIRGIHHKKVWFNAGEFVIVRGNGNIYELWGKVPDCDVNRIKRDFEKHNGDNNTGNFIFRREGEVLSDDEDDHVDVTHIGTKSKSKSKSKLNTTTIPAQPDRNYDINDEKEIDFDSI